MNSNPFLHSVRLGQKCSRALPLLISLVWIVVAAGCADVSKESDAPRIRPDQLKAEFAVNPAKPTAGQEAELSVRLEGPVTLARTEVYLEVKKLVDSGTGERIDFKPTAARPDVFTARHSFAAKGTYNALIHIYSPEVHKMQDAVFYVEEEKAAQAPASISQSASASAQAKRVPLQAPVLLGQAEADIDGDGQEEAIRLLMTQGIEVTDVNPGPFEGIYYAGDCELTASGSGRELFRVGLKGERMFRKKDAPFEIRMADYNGDGHPDFSLGQWGGSSGNHYDLYTVDRDGFRILLSNIYTASHAESVLYPKEGRDGFVNLYYSNADPAGYFKVIRKWTEGSFERGEPAAATENEISSFGAVE